MGSYCKSCPNCGEWIGASWDPEVDDEDSPEPFALALKMREHMREECVSSFHTGLVVGAAILAWGEAIRANDSRRKWEEAWHERTKREPEMSDPLYCYACHGSCLGHT